MISNKTSQSSLTVLKMLKALGNRYWWTLLLWIIFVYPAQAAQELRVAIKSGVRQVTVGTSTPAMVLDGSGRKIGEISPLNGYTAQRNGGGVSIGQFRASQMFIQPSDGGYVWIGDRWYRGRARITPTSSGMAAINHVDLEQYLYSVLGGEMSPTWPQEALKAQAVAARSYALYKRQTAKTELFDVSNTTSSQVYKGLESEGVGTHTAVDATAGQVMTYNGQVIMAVFHSSSGGHTENVEDVWSSPLPYLRGVEDYDQSAPVFQWDKTLTRSEVNSHISGVGSVVSMVPERKTPSGRVMVMKVVGSGGTKRIDGDALRSALGLKSALFTVSQVPGGFDFNGRGYGHGLGLSQWGARGLAEKGVNYQQILSHYYQNATLSTMP